MPKSYSFLIYCAVIFLCSCKKDYVAQPGLYTPVQPLLIKGAGVSTPITGKWQWVSSYHSISGLSTPGTTNYSERIEFGTDSIMTIYRNDTYYYQFTYLYVNNYQWKNSTFPVTLINNFTYKTVINNDTLKFSTFDLNDDNLLIYVKIKQ